MERAAPFTLLSLIKRYPAQTSGQGKQRIEVFEVGWGKELDFAADPVSEWIYYSRKDRALSRTTFWAGGGHGVAYNGVTDKMLLQLERKAGRSGAINLKDLISLGCSSYSF